MKRNISSFLFGIIGGTISSGLMVGCFLFLHPKDKEVRPAFSQESNYARPVSRNNATPSGLAELNPDFIRASGNSTNSVVYIRTVSAKRRSVSWFDMFFDGGMGQQVLSSGSGVIFSKEGHIVTNNHVIEDADEIEVMFQKKPYKATVIGRDPSVDIAVLKIEGSDFPAIPIGDSWGLEVGEWVLAVGNPFNLNSTVTAGIVSAKGRDLGILRNKFPMESFIQTDAAINPGNSGGALVNLKGELIGINTAIISKTGSYAGYGFAVPVDIVKKIVTDLIQYGKVQKAFIGAEITDLDYKLGTRLKTEDLRGVVLDYVRPNGPSDKESVKQGDIIRKINRVRVESKAKFDEIIGYYSPGDTVSLEIERDGKLIVKNILLTNEEGNTEILMRESLFSTRLGAEFEDISVVEKEYYKVDHGVKIANLKSGVLRDIGIDKGFVILFINGEKIEDPKEAIGILERIRGRVIIEGVDEKEVGDIIAYIFKEKEDI